MTWAADSGPRLAHGTVTDDGEHYEVNVSHFDPSAQPGADANAAGEPSLIVSVRCSGRIDSAPFAQKLFDAAGWIAFDYRAYLFQPHQPPMPGG